MKTKTLVAAGIIAAAPFVLMHGASATDANVGYTQACVPGANYWNATVMVTSQWDGLSHVVIHSAGGDLTLAVPAHDTAAHTYKAFNDTFFVRVTSTDAHLHGDLDHTFHQPQGCELVTTTTAVPPTVPEETSTTLVPTPTSVPQEPTTEAQTPTPQTSPTSSVPAGPPPTASRVSSPAPRSGLPVTCMVQAHCPSVMNASNEVLTSGTQDPSANFRVAVLVGTVVAVIIVSALLKHHWSHGVRDR